MKAVLSTLGKFHSFDLARQLHARGALHSIFSGYPRFKLDRERLPQRMVRTFPYVHAPYMANRWRHRLGTDLLWAWEYWDRVTLDRHVARNLPDADVFIGLSGCGLAAGRESRRRGMRYVCDRGSTHIRHQHEVVSEEYARWNMSFPGVDPRIIEREEAEYAEADLITIPSRFVGETFVQRGVDRAKLRVLPYGVDLTSFHPVEAPAQDRLDLLFVGGVNLRKGIPYLLQAFRDVEHPAKSLTIAGIAEPGIVENMQGAGLVSPEVRFIGHVPQAELKALMSRSHALVLPSIEEGLALVMAQAMACGCPVVATHNAGAADLFDDGEQGYIVEARDVPALVSRLQQIGEDRALRDRLSAAALQKVRAIGGWSAYGDQAMRIYQGRP